MVDWLRQCNLLYEDLANDCKELGMLKKLDGIHSELVPLLLEEKRIESSQLLRKSRVQIWSQFVKKRIDEMERKLRPPQIFDNRVFDELQAIRQSHAEAELKIPAGAPTTIDDFKTILEAIDSTSEYAERLRSRSAFNAVKEIFKTGIIITVTLFGVFITLGQQYLPWTLAPLGITILLAVVTFGLIRVYPNISRTHLMMLANILLVIISLLLIFWI